MSKVVVITGGAKGIGRSIAEVYSTRGSKVVILDFDEVAGLELEQLLVEQGYEALFQKVDVSNTEQLLHAKENIIATFGAVDHLIINAGITQLKAIEEISFEDWDRLVNINLNGSFYTLKVFYDELKRNRGKVVFITSGSAITGTGGGAHYAATKAGQNGLMRAAAKDLGRFGVNVNAIAPRVIESEMLTQLYPDEKSRERLVAQIPIGRVGEPKDIAQLAYFLTSEESSYIHGQIILADGGRTF